MAQFVGAGTDSSCKLLNMALVLKPNPLVSGCGGTDTLRAFRGSNTALCAHFATLSATRGSQHVVLLGTS
jgi:hypothetical protein